jgi:MFS family permease
MKKKVFPPAFFKLSVASLLFFVSFNLVIPELPDMLRALGGGQYLGWIIPAFSISALIARPISGWLTDQIGRKFTLIAGCIFCLLAGLLYPLIGAIWGFILVRAIHGFSTGFTPTGFTAYTADIIPSTHRGRAMGWLGVFNNAGTSLGYGLGAVIVLYWGRNSMFWVSAGLAVIALAIFASLPETLPKKLKEHRPKPSLHWRNLVFIPTWKPGIIMALVCISLGSILTVMPDYTLSLGFANKGLYLTWYIAFSLIFRLLSGKISDALGRPWSTAIGTGVQIISMWLLIYQVGPYFFYISAALYGIGQGFNAPSLFAWASDLGGTEHRGKSISTLFISLELGVIFGGLFAGYLITSLGGLYEDVFLMNLLGFVAAFLLSVYFIWRSAKDSYPK